MARLTSVRIPALTGVLIAVVVCGSSSESDWVPMISIDSSTQRIDDDVGHAAGSEHGAPGEYEKSQHMLVEENAAEDLVKALRERRFANVSGGGR